MTEVPSPGLLPQLTTVLSALTDAHALLLRRVQCVRTAAAGPAASSMASLPLASGATGRAVTIDACAIAPVAASYGRARQRGADRIEVDRIDADQIDVDVIDLSDLFDVPDAARSEAPRDYDYFEELDAQLAGLQRRTDAAGVDRRIGVVSSDVTPSEAGSP